MVKCKCSPRMPECIQPKTCRRNVEGLDDWFQGTMYVGINDWGMWWKNGSK